MSIFDEYAPTELILNEVEISDGYKIGIRYFAALESQIGMVIC